VAFEDFFQVFRDRVASLSVVVMIFFFPKLELAVKKL
jgi:hypothetical protein